MKIIRRVRGNKLSASKTKIEKTKNNNKSCFFGSFFEKEKKSYMFNYVSSKRKLSNYLKNLDDKNIILNSRTYIWKI